MLRQINRKTKCINIFKFVESIFKSKICKTPDHLANFRQRLKRDIEFHSFSSKPDFRKASEYCANKKKYRCKLCA